MEYLYANSRFEHGSQKGTNMQDATAVSSLTCCNETRRYVTIWCREPKPLYIYPNSGQDNYRATYE